MRSSFISSITPRRSSAMLASTGTQEAPGLIGLLPGRESFRSVDTCELTGFRIPGDEAPDEEAGAEVEVGAAPGSLMGVDHSSRPLSLSGTPHGNRNQVCVHGLCPPPASPDYS